MRVTAIVDGRVWHANNDGEVTDLLRAVFAAPHRGWAVTLSAWDVPQPPPPYDDLIVPNHRLRVVTDRQVGWVSMGWAALNFLQQGTPGYTWDGWDTYNPDPPAHAPAMPFGSGPLWFPRNATWPLAAIRRAVGEYSRTGQRPTAVHWQQARYF
jgi:hypothetical protein